MKTTKISTQKPQKPLPNYAKALRAFSKALFAVTALQGLGLALEQENQHCLQAQTTFEPKCDYNLQPPTLSTADGVTTVNADSTTYEVLEHYPEDLSEKVLNEVTIPSLKTHLTELDIYFQNHYHNQLIFSLSEAHRLNKQAPLGQILSPYTSLLGCKENLAHHQWHVVVSVQLPGEEGGSALRNKKTALHVHQLENAHHMMGLPEDLPSGFSRQQILISFCAEDSQGTIVSRNGSELRGKIKEDYQTNWDSFKYVDQAPNNSSISCLGATPHGAPPAPKHSKRILLILSQAPTF
tara:strand:+ start:3354 stop:4238 length:885 start_codon:yes stop_codon:yes gene_type:complete